MELALGRQVGGQSICLRRLPVDSVVAINSLIAPIALGEMPSMLVYLWTSELGTGRRPVWNIVRNTRFLLES